ncbi:NAD-dependent dehydratase [Candidatus Entotheonella serta]|nr:NAD-dependent dehydratase [Candidatus Entotheonella serta]
MTALVTGATGFVGANIVRALLDAGEAVRVLVRGQSSTRNIKGLPVDIAYGDLRDVASLQTALDGCHTLYHAAAHYNLWTPQVDDVYAINVEGTVNLLRATLTCGLERVVYTSSVATLAASPDGTPVDETHPLALEAAVGHYKRSKILAEQQAMRLCEQGLPLVIVQPSAPIGPWDVKPTPTGKMVVDFLRGKMPAYLDTGLNLIDVRDVAQGHVLAAQHGKIGERYILGHCNLSLRAILERLAEVSGLRAPRVRMPYGVALAAGYVSEGWAAVTRRPPAIPLVGVRLARYPMYFSAEKAVRELGLPQSPIRDALQSAVQWFRDYGYVSME